MAIELIVGLGNPGPKYTDTRHNCGFMAIDRLSDRWKIPLNPEKRFQGDYGEGVGPAGKLRLLKPKTYMNLSGQSVRAAIDWFKLDPASVLVVYDDMDLPFGRLRLRLSGSAGGHNGMKSIIQHLGQQNFPRLRLGVGAPDGDRDAIGHVLGRFTPEEKAHLPELIDTSADAIELCLRQDVPAAMNRYNPKSS
ncbi:aminoacyl-tRNA hydrolase [Synechococcus sp. PCC 7336]|uniref:aminoacyl-tRNA hydrolase n=1 Tax=Synechococcus sp. PCC 7336 TaxID=195250 RepID=UPI000346448F|nr:aminoacyl-tRNA hydrolase [Synechococcus sp. PCC 7336]